jgi:undecaprenol kinase
MSGNPASRSSSLSAAASGLRDVLLHETNFQIEVGIALLVVVISALLRISTFEWSIIVAAIGAVFTTELLNSAFERLADLQKPRLDPLVKVAKDVSAAAVFMVSLTAAIVGLLIIAPKVADLGILFGL